MRIPEEILKTSKKAILDGIWGDLGGTSRISIFPKTKSAPPPERSTEEVRKKYERQGYGPHHVYYMDML